MPVALRSQPRGDGDHACKEAAAIAKLCESGDFSGLVEAQVPAKDVLQIAGDVVRARIAQADGNLAEAASYFEQAAELEDRLAYMEPAYRYYPVQQSLGAVLQQQWDVDGAEQAFHASLSLMRVPCGCRTMAGLCTDLPECTSSAAMPAASLPPRSYLPKPGLAPLSA